MASVLDQSGSALAVVSLTSLGVVFAMCVWCRKKSDIIQRDTQIYDPQLFQSQSERFRVVRPQRVPNQSIRVLPLFSEDTPSILLNAEVVATEDQLNYQNIGNLTEEPTYVDPIPEATYQNFPLINPYPVKDPEAYVYENMLPTVENQINQEDSDYENTEFLQTCIGTNPEGAADPDYINVQEEKKEQPDASS
ncbi:hypothetical protein SKAU_G00087920 [Synaphobranchus kaupii]|uniref:Linker for activation of T-cells family member 2 n=1 Tax=Synaphobranchus kaupii TaxID=118154 RepID=A0A9Q1J5U8_SYNKA|nr:hypothetical protein SKAU_G00087920 [Synaphobranchus kaupii]